MTEVVYNSRYGGFSYGGFSFSKEASRRLIELGVKGADNDGSRHVCRHDPLVIQVVRELGHDANGRFANLRIAEVSGKKYLIEEYDGKESVKEPKDIEWVDV